MLETADPGYTLDRQVQTVVDLEAALTGIAHENGVRVAMAGTPVSTVKARDSVAREMLIGTVIAVSMIIGFLFWVYRSFLVLALGALPIVTGILLGLVATLLVFGSIHRITLAFGITLLGVAIDYPLHLFSHTHIDERLRATAKRILPPMLLGAMTTIAAFIVLGTGGFTGLAQLAVFIGAGLMAAVITALWVLPSIAGNQRLFAGAEPLHCRCMATAGLADTGVYRTECRGPHLAGWPRRPRLGTRPVGAQPRASISETAGWGASR